MQFSRVGDHTIKCIITEEEIVELGISLEEIMSNGARTQEFMNQIFDLAEQEFETKFDFGIKTVRADFLPDHSLSLTFSEHPVAEGMMEHLKDIVNGLLESIPKEKLEEMKNKAKGAESGKRNVGALHESDDVVVLIEFTDFNNLIDYAKRIMLTCEFDSVLYKLNKKYVLVMDLSQVCEDELKSLSALTDEYANEIYAGNDRRAFMEEHAELIIKSDAIETLCSL